MKKIILFLLLGLVLLLFGKCSHSLYSAFKNFPDYASEEVLSKQYRTLISDIDIQIENGQTIFSIGANLEKINYPVNTVYVAIESDDADDVVIIGNVVSSRSKFIIGGFGYGTLDEQDVIIIVRPINKVGLDSVVVYLTHDN